VAEAGRGEPVLLLHGSPQHWWEWRDVIPGLAANYRASPCFVGPIVPALPRHNIGTWVLPEVIRVVSGGYRRTRLQTPTLLLFGSADPAFPPELVNLLVRDHERYAVHVEVAFVDRAAHYIPTRGQMP
jgi:pimeloyl-ACP methyl ester carboxylesterase